MNPTRKCDFFFDAAADPEYTAAHIGSELPPLSYATLYDSTYTVTIPDSSGKRRWAFKVTVISDPTNDHDLDGRPTGTPILPGHYLSLPDEVPTIIKWRQKTGLHKQVRLAEKVSTAAPLKSAAPSGPLDSTVHASSSSPAIPDKRQKIPASVTAAATQHEPLPPQPLPLPPPPPPQQDFPDPADTSPAAIYWLQENYKEVMRWTGIPIHTDNPSPWQEEPPTMQSGPMQGVSISWINFPLACLEDTLEWLMPVPVVIQRRNRGTNSSWTAKWHPTMIQCFQDPSGNNLHTTTPDNIPAAVQSWLSHHVRHYSSVKN
jgi:hypothetical protein